MFSPSHRLLQVAALAVAGAGWIPAGLAAPPLLPDEALRTFRLADPELVIEQVAAEPEVSSPVALAWDVRGRLFVAEMGDYPNAASGGRVRRLEDRDRDGRYERSREFASGLPFPNSVLPWRDGVLVTAAPDLLWLRDTDDDGVADQRTVLFTGFGTGNPQLRANGLTWGLDGWIYGANGRSDGEIVRPGRDGKISLRGRDFRFRPDTGAFETLPGRSQFGLGRDDWGNRFLSWNTIPLRHEVFPDGWLASQPALAAESVVADCLPADEAGWVYPLSPAPRVFNNESGAHFNALSGLHLFRGDLLGPMYRGNAFVGESLRNLVHRRVLVPTGTSFRADPGESGKEFLASTDPWFHPVNFATGPDGALYVADFYREFVEHPDWVAREMRARVKWDEGRERGRVWRVRRKDRPVTPDRLPADLDPADYRSWIAALYDANGWRRDTAQRLLLERREPGAIPLLRRLTRPEVAPRPETRVTALHTLAVLGELDEATGLAALADSSARVREAAAALGRPPEAVLRLQSDPDLRVRLQVVRAASRLTNDDLRERTLSTVVAGANDRWLQLAASAVTRRTNAPWRLASGGASGPRRPARPPRGADPDREKVVAAYQPALALPGDRPRGAASFARLCLPCHQLFGHGQRVGPDLAGLAARPPDALLVDLLDPSRQVAPDYEAYEILTVEGGSVVGLLASESDTRLTVRAPGGPDQSVPRSRIREIRATRRSLMPDGFETELKVPEVADLLAFLRDPDPALLEGR